MASESKEGEKMSSDEESPVGEAEEVEEKVGKEEGGVNVEAKEKNAAESGGMEGEGKRKRARRVKGESAEKKSVSSKTSPAAEEAKRVERPTRERKTVERFSASSSQKAAVTKSVSIKQGTGIKLKDIPNVFYKLSKRKVDENLRLLHTILFAKNAKARNLKGNIYQFSGFVWTENEEKQRAKMKEKLDKCFKDKLLDFCYVLDIPHSRTTTKKEEISAKLLDFLESPYITRDVLADKKKRGKKRKHRTKEITKAGSGDADLDREAKVAKKRRKSGEVAETKGGSKQSTKSEEDDKEEGAPTDSKDAASDEDGDEVQEESDRGKNQSEDEGVEQELPVERKKVSAQNLKRKGIKPNVKEKVSSGESSKSPSTSVSKKAIVATEGEEGKVARKSRKGSLKEGTKALSMGKAELGKRRLSKSTKSDLNPPAASKIKKNKNKSQSNKKPPTEDNKDKGKAKSGTVVSAKEPGKGRASGKAGLEPRREEMHVVVSDILKEVDFNTATLADILKQLGSHFGMDLMHRKMEVKSIIEEVINNMTDDEDDGEDDGEDEDDNPDGQDDDAEDPEKDDDA